MKDKYANAEYGSLSVREKLETVGFSNLMTRLAAGAARAGARRILKAHPGVETASLSLLVKPDNTLQTSADLQSEERIKRMIEKIFPGHGINVEESGEVEGLEFNWDVDPLDGTGSFSRGQRYSTLGISVRENNRTTAASICNPFEKELLLAEAGKGAYLFALDDNMDIVGEAQRLQVSSNKDWNRAIIFLDSHFTDKNIGPKLELLKRLQAISGKTIGIRSTGSNIDHQRQVAKGAGDIVISDSIGGFYDLSAGDLMIREAGGKFTDIKGDAVSFDTQFAIGSNGHLHRELLEEVSASYKDYQGYK